MSTYSNPCKNSEAGRFNLPKFPFGVWITSGDAMRFSKIVIFLYARFSRNTQKPTLVNNKIALTRCRKQFRGYIKTSSVVMQFSARFLGCTCVSFLKNTHADIIRNEILCSISRVICSISRVILYLFCLKNNETHSRTTTLKILKVLLSSLTALSG